jgi:hypothetical protein
MFVDGKARNQKEQRRHFIFRQNVRQNSRVCIRRDVIIQKVLCKQRKFDAKVPDTQPSDGGLEKV